MTQERTVLELAHDYQVEPETIESWTQEFKANGYRAFEPEGLQPEKTRSIWGRILLIIIIILLLLSLFWPCGPQEKAKRAIAPTPKKGMVGQTDYEIVSRQVHPELAEAKWSIVSVDFKVNNLASRARPLDYSMVQLRDEFGTEFPFHVPTTNRYYEKAGKPSPWGKNVPANGRKMARIYFHVLVGAPKKYFFAGKDLDFRAVKYVDIDLGEIDLKR